MYYHTCVIGRIFVFRYIQSNRPRNQCFWLQIDNREGFDVRCNSTCHHHHVRTVSIHGLVPSIIQPKNVEVPYSGVVLKVTRWASSVKRNTPSNHDLFRRQFQIFQFFLFSVHRSLGLTTWEKKKTCQIQKHIGGSSSPAHALTIVNPKILCSVLKDL